MSRAEDDLQDSALSSCHVGSKKQHQVAGLGDRHLHLWSRLPFTLLLLSLERSCIAQAGHKDAFPCLTFRVPAWQVCIITRSLDHRVKKKMEEMEGLEVAMAQSLVAKTARCSCRGYRFGSQKPRGGSQP